MGQHVRVPEPVYEKARELRDEKDFSSMGDAIRYVFVEAGYDV